MTDKTVIIVHESVRQSITKDAFSALSLILAVAVGVIIDSTVLQVIGGIVWILYTISAAIKYSDEKVCTIPEARKILDKLEAGE